jgi:CHAT domain-containing protein
LWQERTGEQEGEPSVSGNLLFTGTGATERNFKLNASGFRIVHLATHAFLANGRCRANPLTLSGLALAGANRRSEGEGPGVEDGILTAEEIAALDLDGVEWAVLSACETGIGDAVAGEGVLGLRRSFQTAGVGTLVMSLWDVEDVATLRWMERLYRARLDGATTVDAVRSASMEVLEERRSSGKSTHPFYWGAFVAVGDWR